MPVTCVMITSEVAAHPACRERRVKHSGKNNHLSKLRFTVALCTDMRLRLSCAKNHCQNRISVCVLRHVTRLYLHRQLRAFVRPNSPIGIYWRSIHLLPQKHTRWHKDNRMQTHRSLHAHRKRKNLTSDASAEALLWEVGVTSIALR